MTMPDNNSPASKFKEKTGDKQNGQKTVKAGSQPSKNHTQSSSTNKESLSKEAISKEDKLIHLSYLGFALTLILPIFAIFSLVVSFDKQKKSLTNRHSKHYKWLSRSFWIFFIINIPTIISYSSMGINWLSIIFILFLSLPITVWYIIRLIKGWLRHFDLKEPLHSDSWLW